MSDNKHDRDHLLKASRVSPSLHIVLFLAMQKALREYEVMEEDFAKRGLSLRPNSSFTSKQLADFKDGEVAQLINYFHDHHIKARSEDMLWAHRAYQLSDEVAKRKKERRELKGTD